MFIQGLVPLDKSHSDQVIRLLSESFMQDPLYVNFIPDAEIRKKLLPLYFKCYLDYFADYCHIYADSERLNGVAIFYDACEAFPKWRYMTDGIQCGLHTAFDIVKSDHTLRTALRFLRGMRYLKSTWVHRAVHAPTVHIDFLAVRPDARGKGLATHLVTPILEYAHRQGVPATLETHNSSNVALYRHFGFSTVMDFSGLGLHQYCMVK